MTYRERWEKENPGKPYSTRGCLKGPDGFEVDCPDGITDCGRCWNREIPEKAASKGISAGVNDVIPEIVKAAEELASKTRLSTEEALGVTIKDSGSTTEFDTGAHRDARGGKGRCDLLPLEVVAKFMCYDDTILTPVPLNRNLIIHYISEFKHDGDTLDLYRALVAFKDSSQWSDKYTMLLEVAKHYEAGAAKYGADNWKKGMPVYIYIDSAIRHYLKWLRGDKDEPHDRAFVWNIMCCIWEKDYSTRQKT